MIEDLPLSIPIDTLLKNIAKRHGRDPAELKRKLEEVLLKED